VKKILQSKLVRRAGKVIASLFLVYVLTYSVLSAFGSYQPSEVDVWGVTRYWWAPLGFYDAKHAWPHSSYAVRHPSEKTGGWSNFMCWTFAPLFLFDIEFIHKGPPPNTALEPTPTAP
jgi:hypothetical protein